MKPVPDSEKYRWQVKNHILSGCTLPQLLAVLVRHRGEIAWAFYAHRILFLLALSTFNWIASWIETCLYRSQYERVTPRSDPVFIIGHPRTGTTHLHNLLALDPSLAYANTFQCGFPNSFLVLERWASPLLGFLMDETRPMDNMRLSFGLPQEDEIATNALSCGRSPYLQLCIMAPLFGPYYAFGEDCPPAERREWEKAFLTFLKKLTFLHGPHRRLVLKSPVHTGRIPLLLEIFPEAKFVYTHRHPLEVFQSSMNMAYKYYGYCYLNRPSQNEIKDFVLTQYEILYEL